MGNQSEYVSFFASDSSSSASVFPRSMENDFSFNVLNTGAQTFMPQTSSHSPVGTPFMPRTSSASSLHNMASTNALSRAGSASSLHNMASTNAMSRTGSASSLHNMSNAMSRTGSNSSLHNMESMSRTCSSSALHDMSFMPRTSSSVSLHGHHHGMPFMPRRASSSSLHSMSSDTPAGLQKISFLIPHPPGPPTLVHVFTSASPSSPAHPTMFNAGGNFAMSPQPMSPSTPDAFSAGATRKSWLLDEVSRRILHQVEFYFSDLNVATTDHLIKYMTKDPEGYVPITVVASFKKIRTSISNNAQLADILRHSERLIVSDDGKRVKRVEHLTDSYLQELQSRIVVAENLPEDHCHQSLMRIFSEAGSVIAIRTCPPSAPHGMVSSAHRAEDGLFHSTKLHSFVEYESTEQAEKAVMELNDVENWRNGLKVHFLAKPQVKPSPQSPPNDFSCNDVCGLSADGSEGGDEDGEHKTQQGQGCGKGRERILYQPLNSRMRQMGTSYSSPNLSVLSNHEHHGHAKQTPVPRMPDGTRGFSMGRGKAISTTAVRA